MSETFTCPRRIEDGAMRAYGGENSDTYSSGHGLKDQARGCSYCGSMNPDDFMQAVRTGIVIGPTDKSYKVYVAYSAGKFYFQHLSEEQMQEFFELYRDKKINIGHPGDFYVLPFFISRG